MIDYFILFAASLSLLFALMHILVQGRQVENTNLSILLCCISIVLFQGWCIFTGTMYRMPYLLSFHITLIYLVAPFAFFAYHLVVLPPETLPENRSIFFYPVLPAFVVDAIYVLLPRGSKLEILERFFNKGGVMTLFGIRLLFIVAGIIVAYYLVKLLVLFSRRITRELSGGLLLVNTLYVLFTLMAAESAILGYVFSSMPLIKYGMMGTGILFVGSCLVGVRYPRLIQLLIIEAGKLHDSDRILEGVDVNAVMQRLAGLMEKEKLYLDDQLSLQKLAASLDITSHQLSRILNTRMGLNYNNYVNGYRVQEAMDMLLHDPARSVLSIAYDAGFNSKSAFYDAFTRINGCSPVEYRKMAISRKTV